MNDTERDKRREFIWKVLNVIVISILCVILTYVLTNKSNRVAFVEGLSIYFDVVDENMSYEQAIKEIREVSDDLKDKNIQLEKQVEDLKEQVSEIPSFEMKSPALISEGLKIQEEVNNSLIILNSMNYYSQNILDMVLNNSFLYDNAVYYSKSGQNISSETKVELLDTNVLYDGVCYGIYFSSDGKSFAMGSGTYNDGFVIYDDHSLFGNGDGYALFDLQGKYSKISFNVGRTNEYEMEDVILKVYLNDKYITEYSLNAQSPPVPLEINLNYADSLKLELTGGSRVKYGFTNAILYY